jgi:hypothetical protein
MSTEILTMLLVAAIGFAGLYGGEIRFESSRDYWRHPAFGPCLSRAICPAIALLLPLHPPLLWLYSVWRVRMTPEKIVVV